MESVLQAVKYCVRRILITSSVITIVGIFTVQVSDQPGIV